MDALTVVDVVAVEKDDECTLTLRITAGQEERTDAAVARSLADAAVKAVERVSCQAVDIQRYQVCCNEESAFARVSVLRMGRTYEAVATASSASRAFVEALITALNRSRE